jgi:Flp pilus assembly protein TadD
LEVTKYKNYELAYFLKSSRGIQNICHGIPFILIMFLVSSCALLEEKPIKDTKTKDTKIFAKKALLEAEKSIEQNRLNDAKALIQRTLLKDSTNSHAKILWAEYLLASKETQKSWKIFKQHEKDPIFGTRALQGKGISLLLLGKTNEAKKELEKAVQKNPKLWRAWNGLGYYYDSIGDWAQSSNAYNVAIKTNNKSALLFNNRGYSRLLQNQVKLSIEDFTSALQLEPGLENAQLNLRLALAWSGRYEQALLGGLKKDSAKNLNNVAFVAILKGDLVSAEGLLLRAIELDASYNVIARQNLIYLKSKLVSNKKNNGKK